jgi:DNA-directed RNA polymerase specialized sigma24 family protein
MRPVSLLHENPVMNSLPQPPTPPPIAELTPEARAALEDRKRKRLNDSVLYLELGKMVKKHTPVQAENDREDLVQIALERAWKCTHLPDDDQGCLEYTCGIAKRVAKQWRKGAVARAAKRGASFDEDRGDHSAAGRSTLEESIAAREHLARLMGMVKKSEQRALAWLLRNVAGESYYEIAGDEGLPYWNVYKATERLSARFKNLVLLLFGLLACSYVFLNQDRMIRHDLTTAPLPVAASPSPSAAAERRAELLRAQELREEADLAFQRSDWAETLRLLDEAIQLDSHEDDAARRERSVARDELGKPAP